MAKTAVKPVLRRMVVPFSVKAAADPASHTFEGLAAVIGVKDLGNDIIEPGAFTSTLKLWKASGDALPLLNSHDQYNIMSALGQLIAAKETKAGLWTQWEIIPGPEGDAVMTRLTPSKTTGRPIIGKMSIGYIPVKWEIEQPEGTNSFWDQIRHLTEVELKECSLVLFPMAPGAAIDASTVKSFLLSAQATDAKALDVVTKAELRKLATRIGNLLAPVRVDTSALDEKKKGKIPPANGDAGDDTKKMETCSVCDGEGEMPDGTVCAKCGGTGEMLKSAKDDPEHPDNDDIDGESGDDDEDLEVVADLVKDAALTEDDPEGEETPKKKKGSKKPKVGADASETDDVAKAAPYVMQEALQHRLQRLSLARRVKDIGAAQSA